MKRTTTGLCLMALALSMGMNSVLRADQVVPGMDFFVADEVRHQWVNDRNGRTGMLIVSGALLSSPCTLVTNEATLPLPQKTQGLQDRSALTLDLVGCGDGGAVTSAASVAGRRNTMVTHSALLTGVEGEVLQPAQRMVGTGRAALHGGANRFTYYLSEEQRQALTVPVRAEGAWLNPTNRGGLLRLRMDYE